MTDTINPSFKVVDRDALSMFEDPSVIVTTQYTLTTRFMSFYNRRSTTFTLRSNKAFAHTGFGTVVSGKFKFVLVHQKSFFSANARIG